MTPKRGQKLKDTCDICAASKVKCEKQRPQCSRCEKLGHRCFYSPARRKGRPHSSNNQDAQEDSAQFVERPFEQQGSATDLVHTFLQTDTPLRSVEKGAHNIRARDMLGQQKQQHRQRRGTTDYQQDLVPNHQHLTSAYKDRSDMPFHDSIESRASTTGTSTPDIFAPQTEATTSGPGIDADNSLHSSSNTECSDCALLAMQTLQHLTTTSMQPLPRTLSSSSSGHIPHPCFESPTLDARIHIASTAIKCLSAILVCPCSCNPNVGLLNAALCAAILDSYWSIIQSSVGSGGTPNIMNNPVGDFNSTMSPFNDSTSCPHNMQLREKFQGPTVNQQVIVRRVLEELPKAANVVIQFTRRYSDTGDTARLKDGGKEDLNSSLLALAVGQKHRLKDMVDKATNLLATC